jgi:membrane-bound lytic murein transglycosylase A
VRKPIAKAAIAALTLTIGISAGIAGAWAANVRDMSGWQSETLAKWRVAWLRSCAREPWTIAHPKIDPALADAWGQACAVLPPPGEQGLRRWIEQYFEAIPVQAPAFVTGYFEPEIEGRLQPEGVYTSPLYRAPPDLSNRLAKDGKAWSRTAIAAGALKGQDLEIAWADPIDAFFLQIQGSGVLRLPGRPPLRLSYAGNNGHPYFAIGQYLVSVGALTRADVSMQSIRAWLQNNPEAAEAVMNRNPRFIFFESTYAAGPTGAAGVVLTAGRSLAVDPAHIPYGLPVWLDVAGSESALGRKPLRRLMVAQDTGYAIKGPARADYFWGTGDAAGEKAGRMIARGRLYMLLPRGRAVR